MRYPIVAAIGYVLTGLIVLGLVITVVAAAWCNHPFYGINYKHLLLGTYSTLAVLTVAFAVCAVWVVRRVLRMIGRARSSEI